MELSPYPSVAAMDYVKPAWDTHASPSENSNEAHHRNESDSFQKYSISTAETATETKDSLVPTAKSSRLSSLKRRFTLENRPSFKSTIGDWWLVEIGACVISALAMVALVLVVHYYDGKPLPQWPLHINIGTFISVCSKLMSGMLVISIVNVMRQHNWYTFHQRQTPLDTMGLIENAA